jgi:multidrug efflux pump subunit AcrA (membrane-fusion protein)
MTTESASAATRDQEHKIEVAIRTPAGAEHRFEVHRHDRVDKTARTAVAHFVAAGQLADGDYGLALLRDGQATELTDSGRLDDYGIDHDEVLAPTGQGTQTATIPVQITLDHPNAAGRLDGAPVTVGFTSTTRKGVLAVPVNALLAAADGSYAVEVVSDTRRRTVPVRLGLFADGKVEVTGTGLTAGTRVEVPRS